MVGYVAGARVAVFAACCVGIRVGCVVFVSQLDAFAAAVFVGGIGWWARKADSVASDILVAVVVAAVAVAVVA